MRIDTGNIRQKWAFLTKKGAHAIASELDRLYALEDANTPFASRAEVETYLKGKGFEVQFNSKTYAGKSKFKGESQWVNLEEDCVVFNVDRGSFSFDYSALTPALLDKILEAK